MPFNFDLHTHSFFSGDGVSSPEDLIGGAKAKGLHGIAMTAYTILNTEDFSVRGILAQILKSNELNQQYLTPRDSLRKTWNNWLRLRRRKKIPDLAAKDRQHNGGARF